MRLGIGDDAAVVRPRPGWELVLTTDLFLEGVHFRRDRDPAPVCGRRLATRALSDLAAMGASPLALLLSSAMPRALPAAWARRLVRGIVAAGREAGAALIGGDSSAASTLAFDVVGVGQLPAGTALLRSGARPGDKIYVSGSLGLAALGRELLHGGTKRGSLEAPRAERAPAADHRSPPASDQRERPNKKWRATPRSALERQALAAYRRPRARWELGQRLRGRASAAMDISDGLALDLHRLCRASGAGAELNPAAIPAPAGLDRALYGGEDYELLFTLPARMLPPRGFDLHAIGRITRAPGLWLGGRRLPPRGWENWT